jgi:4-amino-4-deoxy-L-arabinose transferase-like glycosyltransferase
MAKFSFKALGLRYCFITFLILFVVPNLIIGVTTELSFDESYYWLFSRYLDFGYFDHPPMVALSIFLGTTILGHNVFGVRLFSNLYLIGTVFIIWDLVKVYKQPLIFWVLMFSMPLIGLSGMVALPDTPLMFFTTLFFWVIKRYLAEDTTKWAGILALVIAAMFYSKYHGLLIVLLTVCGYPAFLKRKSFWMIVISVFVLFFPHIYWQYMNDFVSFRFHLFGRTEKHFEIKNILDYIGGQIFLMGFLNFFLICFVFYKNKFTDKFERILMFNSFGFLVFLFFMSFRNQIEANWTISCSIARGLLMPT